MSEKSALYREVFKSFFLAFKRLSLYVSQHSLSRETLHSLFSIFDTILKEKTEIIFAAGLPGGRMLLNEEPMDADVTGVREIYDRFVNFGLEAVVFLRGVEPGELIDFIKALASSRDTDTGEGRSTPAILLSGSRHIQVRRLSPERLREAGAVLSDVRPEGQAESEGMAGHIQDFLSGRRGDLSQPPEGIFEKLERDPGSIVDVIIRSAKETGNFEAVIKKFIAWMAEHIAPIILKRKPDPSGFMERVFDSFRKKNTVFIFLTAEDAIRSCTDDIKMAMAFYAFSSFENAPGESVSLGVRIFNEERDGERLVPRLQDYFVGRGAVRDKAALFVEKLKAELAQDKEVAVSKKRLDRLMRIAERFDEELEKEVRRETEDLTSLNKRLADEKERTDAIMRHVAEGVVVVDREGRIVMMNPAAEKLLDSRAKESLGRYLVESLKNEHLLAVAKDLDAEMGTQVTKEIELDSKDETTKKVLRASTAVVENEDGDTVGMVSVLSDITHEKQIEEIKSQFVSLVTHELRTPVVAIQKSLELIDSGVTGAINDDQKRFLAISKLNLARLNSLINDLLDMSKLEAGKFVLLPSSFDIRGVIQEVKVSLSSWVSDKEIVLKIDLPEAPVTVNADRDRMVQVMVNLVGNALKFTPKKGEVHIKLKPLDLKEKICQEPCVEIAVHDSGIGIDPKDFKRIFNKFEQVSLVSPVGTGGTGLGLSIAKEIINLHGGDIWVESQIGHGSTFTFVVPRAFRGGKIDVQ
ncbi:MAG: ATP-binding protein [Candidatus Velamenicoccus archaeovorus]